MLVDSVTELSHLVCLLMLVNFKFFCNLLRNFSLGCKLRRKGVTREISSVTCFAMALRCRLQGKLPRVAVADHAARRRWQIFIYISP